MMIFICLKYFIAIIAIICDIKIIKLTNIMLKFMNNKTVYIEIYIIKYASERF